MFSCEYCKIFKNTFFTEHPRMTAPHRVQYCVLGYHHQERIHGPVNVKWSFVQKKMDDFQPLTISAKSSILDVWLGFEYVSVGFPMKLKLQNFIEVLRKWRTS